MNDTNSQNNMKSDGRSVIIWSIITAVVVVVLVLAVWKYALPPLQPSANTQVQTTTAQDLAAIRRIEDSLLTTYQWLNRDSSTYRIPIERAMELIAVESTTTTR